MNSFFAINSINKKILYAGSLSLIIVAGVIILCAAFFTWSASISGAESELIVVSQYQAEKIHSILMEPMQSAGALADTLTGPYLTGRPLPRENVIQIMGGLMANHPLYNGIFTMWEPDAYDTLDRRYAGRDGYASTGRMNLYWYREGDEILRMDYEPDSDDSSSDYLQDYYTIPRESGLKTLINPYVEESQDQPVLMASTIVPIHSNEKFVGITGVDVTLADIDRIADESDLYDGSGIVIIVSEDGTIAGITGDIGTVGEPVDSIAPALLVSVEDLKTAMAKKPGENFRLGDYIGVTSDVVVGDPAWSWKVVILVPSAVLIGNALFLTLILVLIGVIISAGGIGLMFLVARSITRPIQHITDAAMKLSDGDLTVRVNSQGNDEIAVLGSAFDTMAGRLSDTISEVRQAGEMQKAVLLSVSQVAKAASAGDLSIRGDSTRFTDENKEVIDSVNQTLDAVVLPVTEAMRLAESYSKGDFSMRFSDDVPVSGDFIPFRDALNAIGIHLGKLIGSLSVQVSGLMSEMEESNASVEEIASGSQQIARGTNELSIQADRSKEGISRINDSVREVTGIGAEIAEKTRETSNFTNRLSDLSERGTSYSEKAESGMQSIVSSHDETSRIIKEISSQMEQIGDIVRIITDISDQTNLLALNAAIEAARAGDAGKGFAVVAGEVKTLALESQKSAERINSIITMLQNQSVLMSKAIERSSTDVSSGSKAVHETIKIFSALTSSVDEISSRILVIDGSSKNLMEEFLKVNENIHLLNDTFDSITNEIGNTAALTEESSVSLDCISQAINEATVRLDKISREMANFKT